jgi:hypothetical protein
MDDAETMNDGGAKSTLKGINRRLPRCCKLSRHAAYISTLHSSKFAGLGSEIFALAIPFLYPQGISFVRAGKLLNSALYPQGISFVRAGKLLNSALYPQGISFVRAGKLLNSALYPQGISFVRAGKLLNSALYPQGISFVRAGKLLNSALTFCEFVKQRLLI